MELQPTDNRQQVPDNRPPCPRGGSIPSLQTTMRPLSTMTPGERAVVARIDIPPEQRGRLMEMGLLPGTPVELVRFAPLGDPVEIKLRNYHLSLRKLEAEKIFVR